MSTQQIIRAWTIYAAPSIIEKIIASKTGANARMIPNCGCSIFPEEQIVEIRERLTQVCDVPGGPIYTKKSAVKSIEWKQLRSGKSFMPIVSSKDEDLKQSGYWADIYEKAGNDLIAFLKQNPKP